MTRFEQDMGFIEGTNNEKNDLHGSMHNIHASDRLKDLRNIKALIIEL